MMTLKRFGRFYGAIQFNAGFCPAPHVLRGLDEILEERGLTSECENPESILTWDYVDHEIDDGPRSRVLLYLNSGDAFDPALIFYRVDARRGSQYSADAPIHSIHIPPPGAQQLLLEHSDWIDAYKGADWDKWKVITDYLDSVIGDPALWEVLGEEPGLSHKEFRRRSVRLSKGEDGVLTATLYLFGDESGAWRMSIRQDADAVRCVLDEIDERQG